LGSSRLLRSNSVFLGDRVLTSTHRGHSIYLIPLDLDLTPGIIRSGEWEAHVERQIVSLIRPGDITVDIGANVGYHTLAMAAAVGSGGQVHAFEANPDITRLLRATMIANGLDWVTVHEAAAIDTPGTITLASTPGRYGSGHVILDKPTGDYHSVYPIRAEAVAVTLDAMLADRVPRIDLIHMDIEGSEPLALRGSQSLIERSPKIKIITEWSVLMMSDRADVRELVAWLIELGFKFWLIEPGGGLTKLETSALLTLPHCDLLLSRGDPLTSPA
jgi:FkbM family methyltransferase